MRSATATPSSLALCASIGPRTTSPIAQILGRLARQSASTSTKPRSSSLRPTSSAASPAVFGIRPIATINLSKVSSCSPPAASVQCTFTLALPGLIAPILTLVLIFKPRSRVKIRLASRATASSAASKKPGAASRIVTSEPKRFQTEPISRPITPAPMTPSFLGTAEIDSAPSLSRISLLSQGRSGRLRGLEPVAMMICVASTTSRRSPSSTSTCQRSPARPMILPRPCRLATLFFLKR